MKKVLQALSLLKLTYVRSVLFISFLLIPLACQKQFSVEKPNILNDQAQLISEAKKHFEDHFQNTASSSLRKKFKTKADMHKKPNWKKAFVTSGHNKDIVVTPVDYDSSLFVRRQGYIYDLNSLSYLSSYKDSIGNMQTHLLTIVPDSSFSSLNIKKRAVSSSFSGIMNIEDWSGKYLGGLLYKEGKITNVSDNNEYQPNSTGRTEVSLCSTMDWYSCASTSADVASNPFGDPIADSRCSYNYSTSNCSGSSYYYVNNGWIQDYIPVRINYPPPTGGGGGSGSGGGTASKFPLNPKNGDRFSITTDGITDFYTYRCDNGLCSWIKDSTEIPEVNITAYKYYSDFPSHPRYGDMVDESADENMIFTFNANTKIWRGVPYITINNIDASNINDPCLKNIIKNISNTKMKNYITNLFNQTFISHGNQINVKFIEDANLKDSQGYPQVAASGPAKDHYWNVHINPSFSSSSSMEYIGLGIIHELVHSFIFLYQDNGGDLKTDLSTHPIIFQNWINQMRNSMMEIYGLNSQHATALALSGMDDILLIELGNGDLAVSQNYNNLAMQKYGTNISDARDISTKYLNGTLGTKCK